MSVDRPGAALIQAFGWVVLIGCGSGSAGGNSGNLGGVAGSDASASGGAKGGGGGGGAGGAGTHPCAEADACPLGVWTNVTPTAMDVTNYGPGSVIANPKRPGDFYVGGSQAGLWKSSDYGLTWKQIASTTDVPDAPRGTVIAVAGTTPPTVWAAGYNEIHKSTDDGATWTRTVLSVSLYSLQVDPNDTTHLISGLHEADGVYESKDGGSTWNNVSGTGFPGGGISWFPFFINTGSAATTRTKWFAMAQNGASASMTDDGGAHWHIPTGLNGLNHPHGNAQIFQTGSTLFVGGVGGPGQGLYRSADLGANWSRVDSGTKPEAVVWGSAKNVYAMYGWACGLCTIDPNYESAPLPGTTWTRDTIAGFAPGSGPNTVAVTSDGSHYIFVADMWDLGVWRYIEP
ncbi:MAG: hypothetical protein ABJA82_07280 [Myxococcales bacterium]